MVSANRITKYLDKWPQSLSESEPVRDTRWVWFVYGVAVGVILNSVIGR